MHVFPNQRKLIIETTKKTHKNAHKELSMITINPHPKNPTNTQTKKGKQTLTEIITHTHRKQKKTKGKTARDILND